MRADLLCSGSKGNSCLIRTEKACILIDCGPLTKRYQMEALAAAGCCAEQIDAVLITHRHSDHIRQLKCFRTRPVYAPCELSVSDSKKQPLPLDLHSFEGGERLEIGDLSLLALPLSHDAGPTNGFVIESGGEKLVYITDTGYLNSDLMPMIMDADYYIMESNHDVRMLMECSRPMSLKQRILSDTGHLSNEMCSWILSHCVSSKTREIVLAHISEETNTRQLALDALKARFESCSIDCSNIRVRAAGQFEPLSFGSIHPEKSGEAQMEKEQTEGRFSIHREDPEKREEIHTLYRTLCEQTIHEQWTPLWRYGIYPTDEDLDAALDNGEIYLGELDGKTAAVMRLQEHEDALSLHLFGVLAEYRGRHLSTRMLDFMEAEAKRRSKPVLRLDVIEGNERAARVYEKYGFVFICKSSAVEDGELLHFFNYEKTLEI